MNDFAFVAIIIAFFVLAAGLVRICERIIGPDVREMESAAEDDAMKRGDAGMTRWDNAIGLVLAVLVIAYLLYALIAPEKL